MAFLEKLEISGFRSIRQAELEIRPINVLIGANGAGKSNLISFFQMLNASVWGENGLQDFVIRQGGASRLLHYGAKRTRDISASLRFHATEGFITYEFNLTHPGEDTLTYTNESITSPPGIANPVRQSAESLKYKDESLIVQKRANSALEKIGWSGHRQSFLCKTYPTEAKAQRVLQRFLNDCRVYHFNDTTPESPLRRRSAVDETTYLRANGGNLPAFLFYLQENYSDAYRRIVQTLQQLLPWFEGF